MRIIVRVFAILGLLGVLVTSLFIGLAIHFSNRAPTLPDNIVLELDLEKPLAEAAPNDPVSGLIGERHSTLSQVIMALNNAAKDGRVKGIIARAGNPAIPFAQSQELRDAIAAFRKTGRFAIVHAESFGETGNGMQPYYLASAFEQVWLQPMGDLGITGMQAELTFFRGTLDKLQVQPEFRKREEYKTFAEQYTETEPSAANRESTDALVGDLFEQWVAGVAADRGLALDAVRRAVDNAPLLDKAALDAKLVDRLAYWDEAVAWALLKASGQVPPPADQPLKAPKGDGVAQLVSVADYAKITSAPKKVTLPTDSTPVVAVIVGEGAIMRGESNVDPLSGSESFGAATIAASFDAAIENDQVKAILFRVNSPGGSAVASEVVRRKVLQAKAAGKPVIVSMGAVAASGGYWVSMAADKIVAQPATITGSIGVVAGKMVTKGLTDMVGISFAPFSRGANAGMWSANTPFSPEQDAKLNAFLDATYGAFTSGVAEGRKLPLEKVKEIAKGRVYTGRQAKELGLVDALGGYQTAIKLVREAMGVSEDQRLTLINYPAERSPWELVMKLMSGEVSLGDLRAAISARMAADALADVKPVLSPLLPILRSSQENTTMMPAMVTQGL
jgi:protease-4